MYPARSARVRAMRIALTLLFAAGPHCAAPAHAMEVSASTGAHPYASHVADASLRFGIPEQWIWRVMHVESRGNRRALSHAGAMGLMQIMPGTWAMLTARHRLGSDPFDVRANILAGAAYLRAMWDRYGDIKLMLAAYNAGPGRADAYAAGRRSLPAETIAYVAQIAPSLGAADVSRGAAAPVVEPYSWRSASLFTVQPERSRAAPGATPVATPEVDSKHRMEANAARSPSLFIPLSGRDQ